MVDLVLSLVEEFVASSNTVGRSVSMNKLIVWITFCPRSEVQERLRTRRPGPEVQDQRLEQRLRVRVSGPEV